MQSLSLIWSLQNVSTVFVAHIHNSDIICADVRLRNCSLTHSLFSIISCNNFVLFLLQVTSLLRCCPQKYVAICI